MPRSGAALGVGMSSGCLPSSSLAASESIPPNSLMGRTAKVPWSAMVDTSLPGSCSMIYHLHDATERGNREPSAASPGLVHNCATTARELSYAAYTVERSWDTGGSMARSRKPGALRELRIQRAMTQHDVAERLERLALLAEGVNVGVNADMVSKWERGEKRPSALYIRLL